LFGSIGASLDFAKLNPELVEKVIAVLVVGITLRTIAAYAVIFEKMYTWKEKLFVAIAWLPKGTVQAAMGGMILGYANE